MFTRTGRKRLFVVVTVHMGKRVDILEKGIKGGEDVSFCDRSWGGGVRRKYLGRSGAVWACCKERGVFMMATGALLLFTYSCLLPLSFFILLLSWDF